MTTLFIASVVAGVSLLWRTFRYDDENPFNRTLDALPYLLRKPITCGLCFTFWVSLLATIVFTPFANLASGIEFRFFLSPAFEQLVRFLSSWFALGALSTFLVYVIDTFYQVSHYYKHAAHHG